MTIGNILIASVVLLGVVEVMGMRQFRWIILGLGIGLLALCGCKKAASPTTLAPVTSPPTTRATQRTGQTTTAQSGTTSGPTSTTPQSDPQSTANRQAPFATWWNSLTPEERAQFNKLSPEERGKKIRQIMGK